MKAMKNIPDKEHCKSVFLVPFFGFLPGYFPFWAKSCEGNYHNFHWYVYNDKIEKKIAFNKAVTLIPYSFDEMMLDFKNYLDIDISSGYVRRVCDYRLLFYFLRREKEDFDQCNFIGYTDIDMIYGEIIKFIPQNADNYSIISANNEKPCGPFTLINKSCVELLVKSDIVKSNLESYQHNCFDESVELMNILSTDKPYFCTCNPMQPAICSGFNHRKTFSIWNNGILKVFDNRGNVKEGGFHHFSRYKNRKRFKIKGNFTPNDYWGCCKYGIIPIRSRWANLLLRLSVIF
jgi:hypothetical protein